MSVTSDLRHLVTGPGRYESGGVNPGHVVQIDREHCLALLGGCAIGRVVYTAGALPAVSPVAYVLDDGEVLFGTPFIGELADATRNTVVAFQTDRFDHGSGAGWSVLGVGETYDVTDPGRVGVLTGRTPRGFRGVGGRVVALPLVRLTGSLIEPR